MLRISPAVVAFLVLPVSLVAQQTAAKAPAPATTAAAPRITEETPGLLAKAKVTSAKAIATARASAPKGAVFTKGSIREEDGHLIYALQFLGADKKTLSEVNIDGATGKVMESGDHEHTEDPVDPDAAC